MTITTRYALKAVRPHGTFYVAHLQRYTNPDWSDQVRDAKSWASVAGARRAARDFNITNFEVVPVKRVNS